MFVRLSLSLSFFLLTSSSIINIIIKTIIIIIIHHHHHHHHHQENVSDPSTIPTDSLLVQTMASCHSLIKVVFKAISIIYLTEYAE